MNILPKLKKSLRDKIAIQFAVPQKDDPDFVGVVVRLTSEFVALREINNFETVGIQIFRLDAIGEFLENGNRRCANQVLKANGQLEKLRPPKWLDKCETMHDVFLQLQKRDIWPSIEVKDGEDEWYLLGTITHVEEAGINIRHYDAHGKWEKPTPVSLQYITSIQFDGPYEKHFGNYMKMKSRPKTAD